jgi:hypothetical protein
VPYRRADIVTRVHYDWCPFNRRNPPHWLRYWNAWRRDQVVWIEWASSKARGRAQAWDRVSTFAASKVVPRPITARTARDWVRGCT